MRSLVNIFLILFVFTLASFAMAAPSFGRKVQLATNDSGKVSFGFQYSNATPVIAVTFSLKGSELIGAAANTLGKIKWAFYDKDAGTQISAWADIAERANSVVTPDSVQAFSFSSKNKDDVEQISKLMKNSVVVLLLVNKPNTPSIYIDIEDLCRNSSEKFVNLDTLKTGCN